jgi:hypothetical protein
VEKTMLRTVLGGVLVLLGAGLYSTPSTAITDPVPRTQPNAQEAREQHLAEVCAKTTCRMESREIQLKTADGSGFTLKTQPFPYVDDDAIVLYAGEALQLDFPADGSATDKPHLVKVIEHVDTNVRGAPPADAAPGPDGRATLSIEFRQEPDRPDMMLVFRSELGFALKYDATVLVATKDGMRPGQTSSCPVHAGLLGFEHWPFPIAMVILSNFHVVAKDDRTCR